MLEGLRALGEGDFGDGETVNKLQDVRGSGEEGTKSCTSECR